MRWEIWRSDRVRPQLLPLEREPQMAGFVDIVPTDGARVLIVEAATAPTGNAAVVSTALPALADYVAAKMPPPSAMQIVVLAGNATGNYAAPGIPATAGLLFGLAVDDATIGSAAYNF